MSCGQLPTERITVITEQSSCNAQIKRTWENHARMQYSLRTQTHAQRARAHAHTHIRTHARTRAHTHTHTHTHTHARAPAQSSE